MANDRRFNWPADEQRLAGAIDQVLDLIGKENQARATDQAPLPGGSSLLWILQTVHRLPEGERSEVLADVLDLVLSSLSEHDSGRLQAELLPIRQSIVGTK